MHFFVDLSHLKLEKPFTLKNRCTVFTSRTFTAKTIVYLAPHPII